MSLFMGEKNMAEEPKTNEEGQEENPDETSDQKPSDETETDPKEEGSEEGKPDEKKSSSKSKEPEEPETRFPETKKEPSEKETKEERRAGYKYRKLVKGLKKEGIDPAEYEGDDDFDTDEDRPVTKKELDERLREKEREIASESMLNAFLEENPDYKPFAAKIRKTMNDPDYKNIPIGFVADGIAGRQVGQELKKEKEKADEEAEETKTGGSSRPSAKATSKKKVWDMTKDEFAKHQAEVIQKGRR
jgi:hypothetical protein